MKKKKIYRIRKKGSEEFLTLGYNQRTTWSVYPKAVIDNNRHVIDNKENFEVVVFEYELKETTTMNLK